MGRWKRNTGIRCMSRLAALVRYSAVLARTSPRGGCIWVHSLDLSCKDVSEVVNYDTLKSLKTSGDG